MAGNSTSFDSSFSDISGAIADLSTTIFGSSASQSGSTTRSGTQTDSADASVTRKGKTTGVQRNKVDRFAINKAIADVLEGNEGLASILGDEQGAGVFSSTTAQNAVQELVAKVAGEIGKLTSSVEQEETIDDSTRQVSTKTATINDQSDTSTKSTSKGLLDGVADIFGF